MPITRREALVSVGALAAAAALPATGEAVTNTHAVESAELGSELACLTDFEPAAKQKMSRMAWEFMNSGAADELTLKWNCEAYQRIRLKPRVLVDVSKLDTSITLFGQRHPFPILLAPTAYHKLMHPEGELATVRGAGERSATMVVSSMSTTSVEDIAAAAKAPLWFQLYVQPDRGFTKHLVERAQAAGCRAICLTVDTPVVGARNREQRAKFALPPGLERPNLVGLKIGGTDVSRHNSGHAPTGDSIYSEVDDAALNWSDIGWLRSFTKIPILAKGILNPDDADRAVKEGISGIMVSNHGGRNLDTVPATAEALPAIADKVAGRVPITVDGGIRRGTDVLKALAIGANAVLIGRPYLYGLSVGGDAGVARVVHILQKEFLMAMALTGRTSIAAIDRSVLWA